MLFSSNYKVLVIEKKTRKEFSLLINAQNEKKLEKALSQKYIVQSIKRQRSEFEKKLEEYTAAPITNDDILKMLGFLAQALKRGVTLKKALQFLLVSEEKKSVQLLIEKILTRLEEQFSGYYDIFKEFPEYFDNTFLGVVRAGESTGTMPENILQYISDQKKMLKQKQDINKVFVKRGVLFGVVILVAIVIISFVIPQFLKLFKNSPDIPAVLEFFSSLSYFFKNYGLYLLLFIIISVITFMFLLQENYQFKKQCDKFIIKIPVVSDLIRTFYTCQYLYFTGTLLMKNVNYIKIMDILIEQTKNISFQELFKIMRENVIKGVPLHEMIKKSHQNIKTNYTMLPRGLLLPSLAQALEMGSATGNMGQVLYDSFLSYEIILHQKIQKAIKIFDKIFYIFIILVMGSLFYAMGSAMAALYSNAGKMI